MFRLPVWGRYGNGYIYDSDYITKDQAHTEVEQYFGKSIDIGKEFNFDPGALDRPWINNCCAVGLSSAFVEPLEATSIGTTIQQAFLLMHKLINYDKKIIDQYNKSFNDIMENIRDFIVLHYLTKKDNTNFWIDVSRAKIPDSLQNRLDLWKYKMPIDEDFNDQSDYILFKGNNHALIMDGLDLFNRDAIRQEFDSHHSYVKDAADNIINEKKSFEKSVDKISHKDFLNIVRNIN